MTTTTVQIMPKTDTLATFTTGEITVMLHLATREAVRVGSLRCECCGHTDVWADTHGVQADCPNADFRAWLDA